MHHTTGRRIFVSWPADADIFFGNFSHFHSSLSSSSYGSLWFVFSYGLCVLSWYEYINMFIYRFIHFFSICFTPLLFFYIRLFPCSSLPILMQISLSYFLTPRPLFFCLLDLLFHVYFYPFPYPSRPFLYVLFLHMSQVIASVELPLISFHPSAFLQSVGTLCHLENCFFDSYVIWYWQILQKKPLWTFQI
jgi:hypothetical protein